MCVCVCAVYVCMCVCVCVDTVFPYTTDLAVAIVTVSELAEEHASWEVERNERCSRFDAEIICVL